MSVIEFCSAACPRFRRLLLTRHVAGLSRLPAPAAAFETETLAHGSPGVEGRGLYGGPQVPTFVQKPGTPHTAHHTDTTPQPHLIVTQKCSKVWLWCWCGVVCPASGRRRLALVGHHGIETMDVDYRGRFHFSTVPRLHATNDSHCNEFNGQQH